ncbi:class I SAM-dependent methyltransferase [Rickettsiella endosymbiont of Aleochara curtula]|uniref:class I SAM-dependent methyltransferase n=1 Tax=Rickettsiella endosymbiont of Aleochara curtula TaxID=3077936 RepID=UPI00313D497E
MSDVLDRWDPSEYEKNSDFQYGSAISILKDLPIKSNQKILDIGCGPGRITAALSKRIINGKLTGIDVSGKMIRYARKQYGSIENLNFIEMDAQALQFGRYGLKKIYYDWVISFWTLSWIKQHEKVISGITKCLAEKGNIFLLIPLNNPCIENTFLELRKEKIWRNYFINYQAPKNDFSPKLHIDLVEKYGFTETSYAYKKITKEFPDRESLINFARPWLPYLDPVPDVVRDCFLKTFITSYLARSSYNKNIIGFDVFTITASQMSMVRQKLRNNQLLSYEKI